MRKISFQQLLITGFFLASSVFAQPENNTVFSRALTKPVLSKLSNYLQDGDSLTISVTPASPAASSALIILTDSCLAQNFLVYSSPLVVDRKGYHLALSELESTVEYSPDGRNWLGRVNRWKREVLVRFHLSISSESGKVLFTQRVGETYQDQLQNQSLSAILQNAPSFLKGTKREDGFIKRWLEPGLVVATTSVAFYLFYALRSES